MYPILALSVSISRALASIAFKNASFGLMCAGTTTTFSVGPSKRRRIDSVTSWPTFV